MRNYYKITNKEELHNGLQYHNGLNVDIVKFDPCGSCQPGGIYFASRDTFAFLDYGPWVRDVTIPEDAQIYKDPVGSPEKWKADKVILGPRRKWANPEVIKELVLNGCDPKARRSYAIKWAAADGQLDIVRCLHILGCDATASDNYAIRYAAGHGHLEVVKFLHSIGCDAKAGNSCAISWAVTGGHLKVVKFLHSIGCIGYDTTGHNNYLIEQAKAYDRFKVVRFLYSVGCR